MKENKTRNIPIELIAQELLQVDHHKDNSLTKKQNEDSKHLSSLQSQISSFYTSNNDTSFQCNIAKVQYLFRHSFTHQNYNLPTYTPIGEERHRTQLVNAYKSKLDEAKQILSLINSNNIEKDDDLHLYLLTHPISQVLLEKDTRDKLELKQALFVQSKMTNNSSYTYKSQHPINIAEDEMENLLLLSPLNSEGNNSELYMSNYDSANDLQNSELEDNGNDDDSSSHHHSS